MPFEQLLDRVTQAHGVTRFKPNQQGRAIHVRLGTTCYRAPSYDIWSNAAYGSKTSPRPPATTGRMVWRIEIPLGNGRRININFRVATCLAQPRTNPTDIFTFKTICDRHRNTVVQVTDKALFLLFDIEAADEPERVLQEIYEAFVLPLAEQRIRNMMMAFRTPAQQAATQAEDVYQREQPPQQVPFTTFPRRARPTPLPPTPLPPLKPDEEGEGKTWKKYGRQHLIPEIPAEDQKERVVVALRLQRSEGMRKHLKQQETTVEDAKRRYESKLKEFHRAREDFLKQKDILTSLQQGVSANEVKEDDVEIMMLKGVLDSYYEKVWEKEEFYYGLTRPVVMQYSPTALGTQDPCRVLAGKFIVRVSKEGVVQFWREDGRVCREPRNSPHANVERNQGARGWCISPHNTLEWSEDGSICWGTQGTVLHKAQEEADYAQLFLITIQHISYVNPEESYCSLRGYAEYLGLPKVEDPTITSFEQEIEAVKQPERGIEYGGELTPEEMTALGLDPTTAGLQTQPVEAVTMLRENGGGVHQDHNETELTTDIPF